MAGFAGMAGPEGTLNRRVVVWGLTPPELLFGVQASLESLRLRQCRGVPVMLTGCLLSLLQVQVNLVFSGRSRPQDHHEGKITSRSRASGARESRKWGL